MGRAAAPKTKKPKESKPKELKPKELKPKESKPKELKEEDVDNEVDPAVLAQIHAQWPAPTPAQKRAYRSQFSDAYCDELGGRTRAPLVLGESRGWIVKIHRIQLSPLAKVIRYPASRFRYFVDVTDQLAEALEEQRLAQGEVVDLKRATEAAEAEAKAALGELEDVMGDVAGEREAENGEIANALKALKDKGDVVERSKALVALARRWRASGDESLQILLGDFELTEALVTAAAKAAARLERLRPQARGLRIEPHDTPAINRIEGRVLVEMKLVMGLFARAKKKDKAVPSLVPGPGTRTVLASRPKKAAGDAPAKHPPVDKDAVG